MQSYKTTPVTRPSLKLHDLALGRIIEFKFRDATDANKTKADLDRLKQAILEAKALKEIMEKWKFPQLQPATDGHLLDTHLAP